MSYSPRITGHESTQKDNPCGRLVPGANYDSHEQIMEFTVPSQSRRDVVWVVEVDARSGECDCMCEWFQARCKTLAGRREYGTYLEHRVPVVLGGRMLPSITRNVSRIGNHIALCHHARRAKEWLRRHNLLRHIETVVSELERRIDEIDDRRRISA